MHDIIGRLFSSGKKLVVAGSLFAIFQTAAAAPSLFAQALSETITATDTMKTDEVKSLDKEKAVEETDKTQSSAELYALGIDHLKNGNAESAVESFEQVLATDPTHVKTMINLSRAYLDLERPTDAETIIERAAAEEPSNAQAHIVRGRVMQSIGNKEEAIVSYQESIELDKQNPFAYNNLALVYIQDGRHREAIPLLQKAVNQKQDVVFFHNNLGIAYEANGDLTEAEQAFQQALDLEPGYAKAQTNLERTQEKLAKQPEKESTDDAAGLGNHADKQSANQETKKDSTRRDKTDR